MSFLFSRRSFLRTAVVAVASLLMPRLLPARSRPKSFWFLETATGESWNVDDPVSWALENAKQPILERARERLLTLDGNDPQRVLRLVTRRCQLNLLEVRSGQVVVHYWGQHGQGDLSPFFKRHGLARKGIEVTLIDRKREASTVQFGDEFLYGERILPFWPVEVRKYQKKWQRRFVEESDDCKAAPCSYSNYCWEGVKQRWIPWRVLKSAWRHEEPSLCRNCDKPTLLVSFGYFVCGFYKRGPAVTRICPLCSRQFEDRSPWDGPKWMLANLEQHLPSFEIDLLGKADKSELPWTPEGHAHEVNCRLVECLNRLDHRGKYDSYFLRDGNVVLLGNSATIALPPFDGDEDHLEEWCRNVVRLMPAEE